ncbi:Tfp pilus assembly protein PilE [Elusimicrobium simillimum]|uniref:type IV pilin protein n=1 Tax=Elusimicrobium simillimum TaxID=3143438 RepID=UPI003C6F6592
MVVVLIVGILAAIALPQYRKIVRKAKIQEALAVGNALGASIERLVQQKGPFTYADYMYVDQDELDITLPRGYPAANHPSPIICLAGLS